MLRGNIITMAQYYESIADYDKAIDYYEGMLPGDIFGIYFGYLQYKLGQIYEKKGDKEKAIEYYDRLIVYYHDCDEKYKEWVMDAQARREKLFQSIL